MTSPGPGGASFLRSRRLGRGARFDHLARCVRKVSGAAAGAGETSAGLTWGLIVGSAATSVEQTPEASPQLSEGVP